MLQDALRWASTNPTLAQRLPKMRFVRDAAQRFMPGEEAEDALRAAKRLNEGGAGAILTLLGENVETEEEAAATTAHYIRLAGQISAQGLDAEIGVKLTQMGLDMGEDLAERNLRAVLEAAGTDLVWIDMESSAYVDRTLAVYRAVQGDRGNVGVCLQSYLRRTPDDFQALLPLRPAIRLVKGAYNEGPGVAFPKKREVDAAYQRLTTTMLREAHLGRMGRVGLGTHDSRMVAHAKSRAYELGMRSDAWEVEMLFGISTSDQSSLLRSDTRLRVLVSYGEQWFPWYMRRLAERPANVWFVVKKMVGM